MNHSEVLINFGHLFGTSEAGPRLCVSRNFSGGADAAASQTTLGIQSYKQSGSRWGALGLCLQKFWGMEVGRKRR